MSLTYELDSRPSTKALLSVGYILYDSSEVLVALVSG